MQPKPLVAPIEVQETPQTPSIEVHEYFAALGRKGGKSRSKAKMDAIAANLDKAKAARWMRKGVSAG